MKINYAKTAKPNVGENWKRSFSLKNLYHRVKDDPPATTIISWDGSQGRNDLVGIFLLSRKLPFLFVMVQEHPGYYRKYINTVMIPKGKHARKARFVYHLTARRVSSKKLSWKTDFGIQERIPTKFGYLWKNDDSAIRYSIQYVRILYV